MYTGNDNKPLFLKISLKLNDDCFKSLQKLYILTYLNHLSGYFDLIKDHLSIVT